MKKQNLIFIVGGLGILYYFFMRKKTPLPASTQPLAKLPPGLNEGDVIKGTPETVYVLQNGLAHPVTERWFVYNINDYSQVKRLDDYIVNALNKGEVFV
jgi:hypothetical protein